MSWEAQRWYLPIETWSFFLWSVMKPSPLKIEIIKIPKHLDQIFVLLTTFYICGVPWIRSWYENYKGQLPQTVYVYLEAKWQSDGCTFEMQCCVLIRPCRQQTNADEEKKKQVTVTIDNLHFKRQANCHWGYTKVHPICALEGQQCTDFPYGSWCKITKLWALIFGLLKFALSVIKWFINKHIKWTDGINNIFWKLSTSF